MGSGADMRTKKQARISRPVLYAVLYPTLPTVFIGGISLGIYLMTNHPEIGVGVLGVVGVLALSVAGFRAGVREDRWRKELGLFVED